MKLVMTLLARDEADIVDTQLAFHLDAGVDFVIAIDHKSRDGTTEILRSYARQRCLHLIREEGDDLHQSTWVTRMARLAATEFGADWVINSDADEFWWPRSGTLREILDAVPCRFGVIRGLQRHFVPRPETEEPFYERMVVRGRPVLDFASPYAAQAKVVHRGAPNVVVEEGNHNAFADGLVLVREWYPIEVFHFPIRTREQMERKYRTFEESRKHNPETVGAQYAAMVAAMNGRNAESVYRELVVGDDALAVGVAEGRLTTDTRLRDVLRRRKLPAGTRLPSPSLGDDVEFAEEVDTVQAVDAAVRLLGRVDDFEQRLGAFEASNIRHALRRRSRRR
jgi:hypothetical protein